MSPKEKFSTTSNFFLVVSIVSIFIFSAGLYNVFNQQYYFNLFLSNRALATDVFPLKEVVDIGLCLLGTLLFGFSELIHIGISIEQNTRRSSPYRRRGLCRRLSR